MIVLFGASVTQPGEKRQRKTGILATRTSLTGCIRESRQSSMDQDQEKSINGRLRSKNPSIVYLSVDPRVNPDHSQKILRMSWKNPSDSESQDWFHYGFQLMIVKSYGRNRVLRVFDSYSIASVFALLLDSAPNYVTSFVPLPNSTRSTSFVPNQASHPRICHKGLRGWV